MRISDWSSDVCSSDLLVARLDGGGRYRTLELQHVERPRFGGSPRPDPLRRVGGPVPAAAEQFKRIVGVGLGGPPPAAGGPGRGGPYTPHGVARCGHSRRRAGWGKRG